MTPQSMTPDDFGAALAALGWKGAHFCARTGLVANTVWRWRKGHVPIPLWVGEYLRALQALQQLHVEFVAPPKINAMAAEHAGQAAPT